MPKPVRGDKLYRIGRADKDCRDKVPGTLYLETVTFITENIAEGASIPTYVVRDNEDVKRRCPTTMYTQTPLEAWEREWETVQCGILQIPTIVAGFKQTLDQLVTDFTVVTLALGAIGRKV